MEPVNNQSQWCMFNMRSSLFRIRNVSCKIALAILVSVFIVIGFLAEPRHVLAASQYLPSWWSQDCYDKTNPAGILVTTDANTGLQVCYPPNYDGSTQPDNHETNIPGATNGAYLTEWECIELSGRYLAQYRQMPPLGLTGNGKDLVSSYYGWYHSKRSDISVIYSDDSPNSTTHTFPSVGDVLSDGASEPGHTAVITSVSITDRANGNGTVMIVQENGGGYWYPGWNADGSAHGSGPWPGGTSVDNASPYTKLKMSGWNYYDDDFSNPPQVSNVEILHFSGAPSFTPNQRLGVIDPSGNLSMKDGALNTGWSNGTYSPATSVAISGTRIGVLDTSGTLWVKDGALTAGWQRVYSGAVAFALTDVDSNHNRIGVLTNDGHVLVKEGALNATWADEYGPSATTPAATAFALYDTRIGVLNASGHMVVKDGGLGAGWVDLGAPGSGQEVAIGLSGSRYGALDSAGNLWVQDGALTTNWGTNPMYGGAVAFALSDVDPNHNRIGVLDTIGHVRVKEGALNAQWSDEYGPSAGTPAPASALALYDTRIGVQDTSGGYWAKDGGLGASWGSGPIWGNTQGIALPDASAAVGPTLMSAHEQYAIGQDQQLYNYQWSASNQNWTVTQVSPAGVALTGTPSGHIVNQLGSQEQLVDTVGTDGNIHEFVSTQSGVWSAGSVLSPPIGVTFTGSPSSLSLNWGGGGSGAWSNSIFVLGSDGHLYNFSSSSQGWSAPVDVSGGSGVALEGSPSAHWFNQNGTIVQDVYAIGADGQIHEYFEFNKNGWATGAVLAPPTGVTFTGTPLAFTYIQAGTTDTHHSVFAMGSDGHLYNYWGPPTGTWPTTPTDVSGSSGVTLTGSPSGSAANQSGCSIQTVYATGTDGSVHEYVYNGGDGSGNLCGLSSGWFTGQSNTPIGGAQATGSPIDENYILQGTTALRHSVFCVTSGGTLQEFWWVQGDGWNVADHGDPSGTSLTGSSPNGYTY